jgi:cytoskeleton protein RodZ
MAEQAYNEALETPGIGERLRQAREAKGLSLDEVANQTRIPTRHLQHIEREEWDALPAVTYCVGFVRSYANTVGLDGAELGRELRDRLGGLRTRTPAAEYYQPADPARVPPRSLAIIAGIIVVLFFVGYMIWRSTLDDPDEPGAVAVPVPEAQAPKQQPAAGAQPLQPQSVAGQPVTLVASEDVWLRITDGENGPTLFEGIFTPGQRFQVPPTAQQPVIRTGRPQVLRIMVGPRDIGPIEPVERTVSNVSLRAEDLVARQQQQPAAPGVALPAPPLPAPVPPQ